MARRVVDLHPGTEGDYGLVVAIAHSKRRPGYWKLRLGAHSYAATEDGQRFLANVLIGQPESSPIVLQTGARPRFKEL